MTVDIEDSFFVPALRDPIKMTVNDRTAYVESASGLYSGQSGADQILIITVDDEWRWMDEEKQAQWPTRRAVFVYGDKVTYSDTDYEGADLAQIPAAVLAYPGLVKVGFMVESETRRITSSLATLKIGQGAWDDSMFDASDEKTIMDAYRDLMGSGGSSEEGQVNALKSQIATLQAEVASLKQKLADITGGATAVAVEV